MIYATLTHNEGAFLLIIKQLQCIAAFNSFPHLYFHMLNKKNLFIFDKMPGQIIEKQFGHFALV